jgi:general secretion pathway protein A
LFNSLRQAVRQDTPFNTDAVRPLHQLCGGVPRRITKLANLALLAGAGRNVQRIDAETIENAWHELGLAKVA